MLLANADKPNGGIFARFPSLTVPFVDIQSSGAVGPDQFTTTEVTREYDTYSDFPMANLPAGTDVQTVDTA